MKEKLKFPETPIDGYPVGLPESPSVKNQLVLPLTIIVKDKDDTARTVPLFLPKNPRMPYPPLSTS